MILSPQTLDLVDFDQLKKHWNDSSFYLYLTDIFETVRKYRSTEEMEKIARDFFDSEMIQTILERRDDLYAGLLCKILPNALFQDHISLIKRKILERGWESSTSIVQLFCELAPEEYVDLFHQLIESEESLWKIPFSFLSTLEKLPPDQAASLISLMIRKSNVDIVREPMEAEVQQIAYGWKFKIPERKGTFTDLMERAQDDVDLFYSNLDTFFSILYGEENALSFFGFQREESDFSKELVTFIDLLLTPEAPKKALGELLDSYGNESFLSIVNDLIDTISDLTSKELLQEAVAYVESFSAENDYAVDCYFELLMAVATIVIQHYLTTTINLEKVTLEDLFELLCRGWNPMPFQQQIFDKIATFPKDEVCEQLKDKQESLYSGSTLTIIAMMDHIGWPEFTMPLVEFLREEEGDYAKDAAMEGLVKIGSPIIPIIRKHWYDLEESQKDYSFSAISKVGGKDAVDFFLLFHDDEDSYIQYLAPDMLNCPDSRLLDLLEEKIVEYEDDPNLDEAYYSMSVLLNRPSKIADAIRLKEIERQKQVQKSPGRIASLLNPEPPVTRLNLELKCQNCEHVSKYRVPSLIVSYNNPNHSPILGKDIPCDSCGELNEFDLTKSAYDTVQKEKDRVKDMNDEEIFEKSPLQFLRYEKIKKLDSLSDPIAIIRKRVRQEPKRAVYWLQYGSFCSGFGQILKAISCFEKCLSLDSNAVEATFGLARAEQERYNYEEALELLYGQWENWENWNAYFLKGDDELSRFFEDYISVYDEIYDAIGDYDKPTISNPIKELEQEAMRRRYQQSGYSHHSEPIRKTPKAGRNDPCPCGSGKKFKKCCMNK